MPHIVLLGDSIFDNAAYISGEPDVVAQLRQKIPTNWTASLLAIDGSQIDEVYRQLEKLPQDATHLVLSVGGNNALHFMSLLEEPVFLVAQAVDKLADMRQQFKQEYHRLLQKLLSFSLPTTLCTIYNPNFPDSRSQKIASTALNHFNDVIIIEAFQAGIPLIDLRLTCDEATDYANPIEPSARGGEKIVNAILQVVSEHDFNQLHTRVFY